MKRKKCMVLLCHCILNCNSKVDGLAEYEGAQQLLVQHLVANGYGLIQLPCPEVTIYGLRRWGHVKEQFDNPYYRKHCREIFKPILEQLQDYQQNGYSIQTVIGVDGSPSCGVNLFCSSSSWGGEICAPCGLTDKINDVKYQSGQGIFMEEIAACIKESNLHLNFIAVDESNPEASLSNIIKYFQGVTN